MKADQTKGDPATPPNTMCSIRLGAVRMTVKRKPRLVIRGAFVSQVSDIAAHNLDVATIKVALSWGSPACEGTGYEPSASRRQKQA